MIGVGLAILQDLLQQGGEQRAVRCHKGEHLFLLVRQRMHSTPGHCEWSVNLVVACLQVQETDLFKNAYSRVSPYTDPAVEKMEPYYKAAVRHFEPQSFAVNGKA